ncbi:hypothetical protein [Actinoallomurus rhizosphaericola]|uniref:hypothetical protein n=1 Tax=Actinoallomurus rhizosphaericola TaxID=2952536 RepID=UPI0020930A58|nr:hypothetical protein [Actinoallomurus rhizosphaericola]MCO5996544.1 hypothetical protein [Actinoallomurus rhizosphaericola]
MKLETPYPPRIAEPVARVRVSAPAPRRAPRSRRLMLALTLVAIAGFLMGLGLPVHP